MVNALDRAFANLIVSLKEIALSVNAPAEQIVRSAAVIEQTFGGLTTNLWDDPFEWTLPETLSTPQLIVAYLSEVDAVRKRAFSSIAGDDELSRYVPVPSGEPTRLIELLLATLVEASDYRGRAIATLATTKGAKEESQEA